MENPNTTSKPWKVEYAKSSRSSCKTCKQPIGKGSLRIAKIVSARQFEGVMPIWNHVDCILKYPGQFRTIDDVEGLDILESEDQKKIKKYFESLSEGSAPTNAYKLVEGIDESAIEKSKSSRATCKSCNQKIAKGEIRISTMADPENPWFRGTVAVWRHAKCFLEIGWWTSPIEKMSGWESLSPEDKHSVQSLAEQYIQDGCRIDTKQEAEEKLETSPQGSKMAEDLKHGNEGSDEGIGKKRKAKKSGTKSDENKKGGSSLNKKANKLDEGMGRESPQSSKNLEMQTKLGGGLKTLVEDIFGRMPTQTKTSKDEEEMEHSQLAIANTVKYLNSVKSQLEHLQIENKELKAIHTLAKEKLDKEYASVPLLADHHREIKDFAEDQQPLMKAIYQACRYKQMQ